MHQPTTRVVTRWRLIPFLLLAAVLHILAIIILPQPRFGMIAPQQMLEVRLMPVIPVVRPPEDINPSLPNEDVQPEPKARRTLPVHQPPTHIETPKNPSPPPDAQQRPESASTSPPRISVESLMNSARRIARDEARHTPPSKKETPGIEDRPLLPALANALNRKQASEVMLANGVYRVRTPSGTEYCFLPLPDIAISGTPVKPTIVPSTCP